MPVGDGGAGGGHPATGRHRPGWASSWAPPVRAPLLLAAAVLSGKGPPGGGGRRRPAAASGWPRRRQRGTPPHSKRSPSVSRFVTAAACRALGKGTPWRERPLRARPACPHPLAAVCCAGRTAPPTANWRTVFVPQPLGRGRRRRRRRGWRSPPDGGGVGGPPRAAAAVARGAVPLKSMSRTDSAFAKIPWLYVIGLSLSRLDIYPLHSGDAPTQNAREPPEIGHIRSEFYCGTESGEQWAVGMDGKKKSFNIPDRLIYRLTY